MERQYIKGIFVISILLNAFLCGILISGHIPHDHGPFTEHDREHDGWHKQGPPEQMIFGHIRDQSQKLSSDGQKTVERILQKYDSTFTFDSHDEMRNLFTEIHQTITAQKFDKVKLKALHDKIHQTETKQKNAISDMILDIASTLSDDDRINLFKNLLPPPPDMEHDRAEPPPK